MAFFKNRTPKFREVIGVLNELEQSEKMGGFACAEFLSEGSDRILEDRETRKLNHVFPCIRKVLGKRHLGTEHDCHLPGSDHTELWKTKEGEIIYVTQPYGISWNNLRALVKKGEELGLEIDISAESTYFPGRTLLIKARKKER